MTIIGWAGIVRKKINQIVFGTSGVGDVIVEIFTHVEKARARKTNTIHAWEVTACPENENLAFPVKCLTWAAFLLATNQILDRWLN